jgi:hypothetical protein
MDSMKRLEAKRQFSAVAQSWVLTQEGQKCLIFQWGLTDTLSASLADAVLSSSDLLGD